MSQNKFEKKMFDILLNLRNKIAAIHYEEEDEYKQGFNKAIDIVIMEIESTLNDIYDKEMIKMIKKNKT